MCVFFPLGNFFLCNRLQSIMEKRSDTPPSTKIGLVAEKSKKVYIIYYSLISRAKHDHSFKAMGYHMALLGGYFMVLDSRLCGVEGVLDGVGGVGVVDEELFGGLASLTQTHVLPAEP